MSYTIKGCTLRAVKLPGINDPAQVGASWQAYPFVDVFGEVTGIVESDGMTAVLLSGGDVIAMTTAGALLHFQPDAPPTQKQPAQPEQQAASEDGPPKRRRAPKAANQPGA